MAGNVLDSLSGPEMPAPRRTPSLTRSMARLRTWLPDRSRTTPSAVSTGTPLLSSVPSTRAKRAVSLLSMTSPRSGSRRTRRSHCQPREGPGLVLGHRLGERAPAPEALEQVGRDGAQARVRRQVLQDGERAVQRQARFHEGAELVNEGEDVATADATATRRPGQP